MAGGVVWRPLLAGAWLLWLLPWASAVRRSDFPAAFLFGTATSSYQVITLDLHFFFSLSSALVCPNLLAMKWNQGGGFSREINDDPTNTHLLGWDLYPPPWACFGLHLIQAHVLVLSLEFCCTSDCGEKMHPPFLNI